MQRRASFALATPPPPLEASLRRLLLLGRRHRRYRRYRRLDHLARRLAHGLDRGAAGLARHQLAEFVKVDRAVVVQIKLRYEIRHLIIGHLLAEAARRRSQLTHSDRAVTVQVEGDEGRVELVEELERG